MFPGAHAAATPDKPAIVMGTGEVTTYRELDDRAGSLAIRLAAEGVGPEDRIAILADRSCELILAIVAVLRVGRAVECLSGRVSRGHVAGAGAVRGQGT